MTTANELRLEALKKQVSPAQYRVELARYKKYKAVDAKLDNLEKVLGRHSDDYIDILKAYDQHLIGKVSYKKLIKYLDQWPMKFWQLQVSYLGQLQIIELEQDIEPTTQEILKEIRRVFDTKRLNHNQLHYMFC